MLNTVLGDADRFAIVDVETTGLRKSDRIVEIAIVTLDAAGNILDEWDTLVNPERDVGPVDIHGVTASMVSAAPSFIEIAGAIGERIYGALLVAHNLAFDARMLRQDFDRIGARLSPGDGVCTLRLGHGKLRDVCREHGVVHEAEHRALADARATAELLLKLANLHDDRCKAAHVVGIDSEYKPRTLRREAVTRERIAIRPLARLSTRVRHYGRQGAELAYLDMLDRAVADLVITPLEQQELLELAASLGLTPFDTRRLHRTYVDELAAAAMRDGVITEVEQDLLRSVSKALGEDPGLADSALDEMRTESAENTLQPGARLCFTGTAVHADGTKLRRSKLEQIARDSGLQPTDSVAKDTCDFLIAADVATQSGKAGKARRHGIPIMSVDDFLRRVRLLDTI